MVLIAGVAVAGVVVSLTMGTGIGMMVLMDRVCALFYACRCRQRSGGFSVTLTRLGSLGPPVQGC